MRALTRFGFLSVYNVATDVVEPHIRIFPACSDMMFGLPISTDTGHLQHPMSLRGTLIEVGAKRQMLQASQQGFLHQQGLYPRQET